MVNTTTGCEVLGGENEWIVEILAGLSEKIMEGQG